MKTPNAIFPTVADNSFFIPNCCQSTSYYWQSNIRKYFFLFIILAIPFFSASSQEIQWEEDFLNLKISGRTFKSQDTLTSPFAYWGKSFAFSLPLWQAGSTKEDYEERFKSLKDSLLKYCKHSSKRDFVEGELLLHEAMTALRLRDNWRAAWRFRAAFHHAEEAQKRWPEAVFLKKTWGMLHALFGIVPERYRWGLEVLGIQPSFCEGLEAFHTATLQKGFLGVEAKLWYAFFKAYALGEAQKAYSEISLSEYADERIFEYSKIILAAKAGYARESLFLLQKNKELFSAEHLLYLQGELLFRLGRWAEAKPFLEDYTQKKSTDFQQATQVYLWYMAKKNGDKKAQKKWNEALKGASGATQADKSALRYWKNKLPLQVLEMRLAMDSRRFREARGRVKKLNDPEKKYAIECAYRLARIAEFEEKKEEAIDHYFSLMERSTEFEGKYFIPYSYLRYLHLTWESLSPMLQKKYIDKALKMKGYPNEPAIRAQLLALLRAGEMQRTENNCVPLLLSR